MLGLSDSDKENFTVAAKFLSHVKVLLALVTELLLVRTRSIPPSEVLTSTLWSNT